MVTNSDGPTTLGFVSSVRFSHRIFALSISVFFQKSLQLVGAIVVGMHRNLFNQLRNKYPSLDRNNANRIANKLNNADESRKILVTNNFIRNVSANNCRLTI